VSWRVEVQRSAEKELARIAPQTRPRIGSALRALVDDPFPHGAIKLHNRDGFRIRVGEYRVLDTVDRETRLIRVVAIGHRKDVYR
jgi:mRNA interferase RelE/StbE